MNNGYRILLVDGDEGVQKTLTPILRKQGYEIEMAATGQEALEKARESAFNLAFLDVRLPDMEGVDMIAPLKQAHPFLAVIMITGHASVQTAVQALSEGGAAGYITKPWDVDELLAITREVLEKQRAESQRETMFEALRKNETRFRSLFEAMAEGIILIAPDGQIVQANAAAERILGLQRSTIRARNYVAPEWEIYRPDGTPMPPEEMACPRAMKERRPVKDIIMGIKHPDGTIGWINVSAAPLTDEADRFMGVVGTFSDITERMRAESQRDATLEALRESEERFRFLAENMADIIWTLDRDFRTTYVSPSIEKVLGFTPEERKSQPLDEMIAPESLQRVIAMFVEELQRDTEQDADLERVVTIEVEYYHAKGHTVWMENSVKALRDKTGAIVGMYGSSRDITERVRADEERESLLSQIRAQARQMQGLIDTVPEGMLLLDAKDRVVLANPVAERDLALLADAKVGDTLTRLGDRPLAELLTSPPTEGLWHEVQAEGRAFEVIARPMQDSPQSDAWVLVINDVTHRREVRMQLEQQERLAAVGQLAAGVAHDFNNIMASIVLYTKMLLNTTDLPPKTRQRLETVSQQAYRATDLVQQILDFSRRAVLERRPMDLTPVINEVVKLLERTVPESIKLEFTSGVDEYTVNADPTRVQQAILNLVVNARDAMLPQRGGELRIALSRTVQTDEFQCVTCGQTMKGEWVRITVTDTGSGILPDVLPHIFEPFFTTKEVGAGTGLGLAQVYGIVKQHEGHVDVSTEVEIGTTFTLYLPALVESMPEVLTLEAGAWVQGQGETVLVVEDDATLRQALVETLELLNYRVLEAADGREALDILARTKEVALVLSDLVMPDLDGYALFHAIRQRGLAVPMVMLSGHPRETELTNLQAQGLAGWLLKPPSLEQLAQLLARALNE